MKIAVLAFLLLNTNPDLDRQFERDVLIAIASEPACHRLDVYLAVTNAQRRQGLMFVRRLPETSGMLFLYDRPQWLSIWMKNTLLPLDVAFVGANGEIINIVRNAEPQSERSMVAEELAQFVLELNAGAAERLGLDENSRLLVDDLIALRRGAN